MTKVYLDEDDKARLLHAGVQGQVFMQRSLELEDVTGLIESTTVTGRPKIVKAALQVKQFNRLYASPCDAPYVLCISSIGTDLRAKFTAAFLLNRALRSFDRDRYSTLRSGPVWHMLTGSYSDEYRDRIREVKRGKKPALIVLSNVTTDSSEVKIEKLRDLLEVFADVPRIVTITGEDPYTFFASRLQYPLDVGLNLSKGGTPIVHGRRGTPPKKKEEQASRPRVKTTSKTTEL